MAEIMEHDEILKPHRAKLIGMLLLEDGTLTAERRHDCDENNVCFAIGIQGHHICHRGTPLVSQAHGKQKKYYCSWVGGKSPQKRFEEEYPGFSTDWKIQFEEYTQRMRSCLSVNGIEKCIQAWNPGEIGRVQKIKTRVEDVVDVLGW